MAVVRKRALAERDLQKIWQYTNKQWGEQQADNYLDALARSLRLLSKQPMLGRERQDINPTIRSHYCEQHVIYYQVLSDGIMVVRVLHKRMDAGSNL